MMVLDPITVRSLLVQSTRRTWRACLRQRPAPRPTVIRKVSNHPLVGSARFTGTWCGSLRLLCPPQSAVGWTSAMFDILPGHCSDADVIDTVGELANIVAGGLLESLPFGTVLTPPTVTWGVDTAAQTGRGLVSAVEFDAEPMSFIVALVADQTNTYSHIQSSDNLRTSLCAL